MHLIGLVEQIRARGRARKKRAWPEPTREMTTKVYHEDLKEIHHLAAHLNGKHGLTPDQISADLISLGLDTLRWAIRRDMVPNYLSQDIRETNMPVIHRPVPLPAQDE